jgi:hypothetical protein
MSVAVDFRFPTKEVCLLMSERKIPAGHELRLTDATLMLLRLDANTLET